MTEAALKAQIRRLQSKNKRLKRKLILAKKNTQIAMDMAQYFWQELRTIQARNRHKWESYLVVEVPKNLN